MSAEAFEGCAVKGFTMVRMGDADEEFRALLERFSVKVHGAVFGYDIMYVRSCSHYSATLDDYWCDLAAALVGG